MIKLVTGGNGYIGRYVVSELIRKGYKVRVLVKKNTDISCIKNQRCEIVEGDILRFEDLDKAMEGCDTIMHLAAIVGSADPVLNRKINYEGAKNVVNAALKNKIKRFIFTSSISAVRKRLGPYGQSKLDTEKYITESFISYTIFRPTLVYGAESQGLWRIITNMKRFPFFIPMIGFGKYFRQPVFVKDLAKMIVKSIDTKACFNKTYTIGGGKEIKFIDLVRLVSKLMKLKKILIPIPISVCRFFGYFFEKFPKPLYTTEHIRSLSEDTKVDITPLKKDLYFRPIELEDGLKEVLNEIEKRSTNKLR